MLASLLVLLGLVALCAAAQRYVRAPIEKMSSIPRLYQVQNFASDVEMDHIMRKAFKQMRPQNHETETGVMTELAVEPDDPVLEDVYNRIRSVFPSIGYKPAYPSNLTLVNPATRSDRDWVPTLRVRRYLADGVASRGGDNHPEHSDYFERHGKQNVLLASVMLYLSTPEAGGHTVFHEARQGQGHRYPARRGNLAIWWSCTPGGANDMKSLHSGAPVLKGIKWNAVHFIYDHIGRCAAEAADYVYVPEEVRRNKPQTNSTRDSLFGTAPPPNVRITSRGATLDGAEGVAPDRVDRLYWGGAEGEPPYEDGKGKVKAAVYGAAANYDHFAHKHRFIPPTDAWPTHADDEVTPMPQAAWVQCVQSMPHAKRKRVCRDLIALGFNAYDGAECPKNLDMIGIEWAALFVGARGAQEWCGESVGKSAAAASKRSIEKAAKAEALLQNSLIDAESDEEDEEENAEELRSEL